MKSGRARQTLVGTIAVVAMLVTPLGAQAPPSAPQASPSRRDILAAGQDVMQKARYCSLVTLGEDGHPQARIVDPLGPDAGFTTWIATNPLTRKVAQIQRDSRVTLLCFDAATSSYVTVLGKGAIVTDTAEKAQRWKEEWTPFYASGATGNDVMLIRVTPIRMEIVSVERGLAGDPKTWRPLAIDFPSASTQDGAGAPQAPSPQVTINGRTWTQEELFRRNVGAPDAQTAQFPPHKIIGNIYYIGTASLASFLIVTPQGNLVINSSYERNVAVLQKSVEQLGFKFADTKILLGSHAHGDHQEGDALIKQLTGAQVMTMAEDVPALQAIKPGGKDHPIDRVLHDGDTVTLGGTTLVAHLTPGHTRGCTTWTLKVREGEQTYDVVISGSLGVNPGFKLVNNPDVPQMADEFRRSFKVMRSLPCDVPLASHPAMYNMADKFARLGTGGPNPFIDPAGYKAELDLVEAMFQAVLTAQQKAAAGAQ